MRHMRLKFTLAALLLVCAVGYLAFAGLKDGLVYHMDVDQYAQSPDLRSQRVRIVGKVAAEGLDFSPAKLNARFKLLGQTSSVPVAYRGAIPDLFKADVEVVVEGKQDSAGVFQADVLMTKCASKYQSEEHGKTMKAKKDTE